MFEAQTYETILDRSLDRVSTDIDKREGSLIMNAIAPVSAEHANLYILLDWILQNGYADTATREYLIKRCKERGITPYEATYAVLKGKFNMEIPLESRFNHNELNYKAIKFIETADGWYYYQMECETAGTEGNKYFGALDAIDYIDSELEGELVELLIPAEDEEDTEVLRARYLDSFNTAAFGGNKADYVAKVDALDGVGGTVVVPAWNGGGTVKLLIINSSYSAASDTLVNSVQEAVDPNKKGMGVGIAPIGHKVTVESAKELSVSVACDLVLYPDYTWTQVKPQAEDAVKAYLLDLRKQWEKSEGEVVVRISQIENRLLNLDGVMDVTGTRINGAESNLELAQNEIPVLGGVSNVSN